MFLTLFESQSGACQVLAALVALRLFFRHVVAANVTSTRYGRLSGYVAKLGFVLSDRMPLLARESFELGVDGGGGAAPHYFSRHEMIGALNKIYAKRRAKGEKRILLVS